MPIDHTSMVKHCRLDIKISLPVTSVCNPDLGLLFCVDFVLPSFRIYDGSIRVSVFWTLKLFKNFKIPCGIVPCLSPCGPFRHHCGENQALGNIAKYFGFPVRWIESSNLLCVSTPKRINSPPKWTPISSTIWKRFLNNNWVLTLSIYQTKNQVFRRLSRTLTP